VTERLSRTVAIALVVLVVAGGYAVGSHLSNSGPVDGPGSVGISSGPSVTVDGSTTINLSSPSEFASGNTVRLETADGNVTFTSSANTEATIHVSEIKGTWTNVTAIDATGADLTVDPDDKASFTVGDQVDSVSVRDSIAADDGTVDFVYSGTTGTSKLTLRHAPASTKLGAVDADNGTVLDVATSGGSGVVTFDDLDNSEHAVTLQTNSGGPGVDNGSASPQGNVTTRWQNETLAIDVSDPDMPGDTLTVEAYVDGTKRNETTVNSNTTARIEVDTLAEGTHEWNATVTDSYRETAQSDTFNFTVDHYDPVASNPDPTGDIATRPTSLSVDISDRDFANDGDNLTVNISLDGSEVGNATLASNGTVTANISSPTGGQHDWSVVIEDEYGQQTVANYSFRVPADLLIRQETNTSQLVDDASVQVEFFFETGGTFQTIRRNTTDGTINLTGLPVDRPFVVFAEADGYLTRRIFVRSIYDQQSVYLLNESEQSVETIFQIEDFTGSFPQDTTVVEVQRALNGSQQTIEGDFFGANAQFPAQLAYNKRHYLVLRNTETGETRPLGTFTPLSSDQQTVTVSPSGDVTIEGPKAIYAFEPTVGQIPARDGIPFNVSVASGERTFKTWNISIYYINSSTTDLLATKEATSGDGGRLAPTLDLGDRKNGTLRAVVTWESEDGTTGEQAFTKRVVAAPESEFSLLQTLAQFVGLVPSGNQDVFTGTLAILLVIALTAGAASRIRMSTEMVGGIALLWLTAFAIIGWLSYNIVFVGLVAWASIAFLRRRY